MSTGPTEGGSRHILGVLVALLVAAIVFVGAVVLVRADTGLGYEPSAQAATSGGNVSMSVFPDSHACHGSTSGAPGGGSHLAERCRRN